MTNLLQERDETWAISRNLCFLLGYFTDLYFVGFKVRDNKYRLDDYASTNSSRDLAGLSCCARLGVETFNESSSEFHVLYVLAVTGVTGMTKI